MKKNILNRPMFKQVKSPAYGTGISANLVSDEQRQRYNYGGRVRANTGVFTGGPVRIGAEGQIPTWWDYSSMGPIVTEDDGKWYKRTGAEGEESTDYIEMPSYQARQYPKITSLDLDYLQQKSAADAAARLDPNSPVRKKTDRVFEEGTNWRENIQIPGADVTIDKTEDEITDMPDPHLRRKTKFEDVIEDTETIDTEPTAYETLLSELDKSSEEKKKLGRGKVYMDAAAAAAEWGTAGTKKERGAAISKGLTKAGETAMKAATEGMDLKDKVKILKTMEDVKGGHKMDVWEAKFDNYYKRALEISGEELDLKKITAEALNKDIPPKDIYKSYVGKGVLSNPMSKAEILSSLVGKEIPVAADDKEVKQFSSPDNDGLVFIDAKGKIWRNTNGDVKTVDVWQDTEFFGE